MTDYSPQQRLKNQRTIVLVSASVVAVVIVSGLMQSWPGSSYVVALVVVGAMAGLFWRLFAASDARPIQTDRKHARWPYLSKKKMDEIIKNNTKR